MGKRIIIHLGTILTLLVFASVFLHQARSLQPVVLGAPAPVSRPAALPAGLSQEVSVGDAVTVTQQFTLSGGWNTLYLEVEPANPWSAMEDVFGDVADQESVWTWNVPLSRVDYIVDPAEGLWNEPGWKRYFPEGSVDENGVSRAFLTNLLSLHANKGYLVKMADGVSATVTVTGRPVVRRHRWVLDSYNLAGFPIKPGATPTVAAFFSDPPVSAVRHLTPEGEWQEMAAGETLEAGRAYLVYYGSDPNIPLDYTAPLQLDDLSSDGLFFAAGLGGRTASFVVENLSPTIDATVRLSLVEVQGAMALKWDDGNSPPNWRDLPADVDLPAGDERKLYFLVPSADQSQDGMALLEIASDDLGVRWRVPVAAQSTSLDGLWVGDVVVNDVSEGRLGATNVEAGALTIALLPGDENGLSGAAQMQQANGSLALTLTLDLPNTAPADPPDPGNITGTAPYIGGYAFVDANRNGQRDGDEQGLEGVTVTLGGNAQTTGVDGSYVFDNLAAGTQYGVSASSVPAGYTADFEITVGMTGTATNALPSSVTLGADGRIDDIAPEAYKSQAIDPSQPLPYEPGVDPQINFGYVTAYEAYLGSACGDENTPIDTVKNGVLHKEIGANLNDLLGMFLSVKDSGQVLACGEIAVGAPTQSDFRYRVILRVANGGSTTELLPYYEVVTDTVRISAPVFAFTGPLAAGAGFASDSELHFPIAVEANDPLNPYKHKYHPDHDNLDAGFLPLSDDLDPYLFEAFAFRRDLRLTLKGNLQAIPDFAGLTQDEAHDLATELDWGGATWGGTYEEVIRGIHKNDITVKGYFVVHHLLQTTDLIPQDYDP